MQRQAQFKMAYVAAAMAALVLTAISGPAAAQKAGDKLHVVYPFAAGGSGDGAGRLLTEELARHFKMKPVFENRGGAGGRIGLKAMVGADPDGSELVFAPMGPMAIQPSFHPNMGFDPFKDFRAVSMVASFDLALSTVTATRLKTLAEAVQFIKANPDKASSGVPGAGGLPHFFTFMLGAAAKVDFKPVVYRGSGPAITDIVAGHLPFAMLPTSEAQAQHLGGKLRILARSGASRSADLPDVPTFTEAGYKIQGEGWYAMFAPAKMSDAIADTISKAIITILAKPEVSKKIADMGLKAYGTTPAEMARIHKDSFERWRPAVKASGFKPGAR